MKFKFDQIAINSTAKKKPEPEDAANYIGLEHLTPGTFEISEWGSSVAPVGEKLLMKKGDVLFGRRRAYQRKVGIAPFDGIFSAHGMVLRPRTEVVDESYFPFFISSDQFMNEAVRISVGSLSPTINWGTLKNCEFDLLPMEEQKKLAELLWAANDLKEKYKKAITATDEMLKAKFREMFGDPFGEGFKSDVLSSVCHVNPRRDQIILGDDEKVSFIPMSSVSEDGMIINPEIRNYFEVKKGFTYFKEHDVLFAKITPCMENGKGAIAEGLKNNIGFGSTEFHIIRAKEGRSSPLWLLALTLDPEFRLRAEKHMTGTGGQRRVPSSFLSNFPINQPDIVKVGEYDKIYVKAESAKTALKKSIADIDQVMKGLINGWFC